MKQSLFAFFENFENKAHAVAKYDPKGIERIGDKIWFSYKNKAGSAVSAYYDITDRKFRSVVRGTQYGKTGYAVRNLIARPVVEGVLGE